MKQVLCSKCKKNPAVVFISKVNDTKNEPEGYCIKCAMEMNIGPVKHFMDNMGISADDMDAITEQVNAMLGFDSDDDFEEGGAPTMPSLQSLFGALGNPDMANQFQNPEAMDLVPQEPETTESDTKTGTRRRRKNGDKGKNKKRRFLGLYCTDLTARARNGELDNIIGRDQEIDRAIQILCRRSKNNPCLIGEPGVGKTAIAEGLAERIANGQVPAKLADKEIHLLDLTALVAGTQFRGQFESRVKGLIDEVKSEGNIILFIDEIHNLVGAGDAEGNMNAANIMKPALSRGEIQVIGATTFNEYRRNIEKDAALERRFQPIKVDEPSIEDTYQILLGIKKYYEDFHRVQISDTLVHQAVVLSERYITDRFLPDKAIDLLDEACTAANLRNKAISEAEIAERDLADLKADLEALEAETENPDYEEQAKVKSEIMAEESKLPALQEAAKDNQVTRPPRSSSPTSGNSRTWKRLSKRRSRVRTKPSTRWPTRSNAAASRSTPAGNRHPSSLSDPPVSVRPSSSSSWPISSSIRPRPSSVSICPSSWRSSVSPGSSVRLPDTSVTTRPVS